jgi:hypothetical protein
MRLDADILQETRRLYEWMLEPLYSITGQDVMKADGAQMAWL